MITTYKPNTRETHWRNGNKFVIHYYHPEWESYIGYRWFNRCRRFYSEAEAMLWLVGESQ